MYFNQGRIMTLNNQQYNDQPFDLTISNPMQLFKDWFDEAATKLGGRFNGFALATAVANQPTARMVLLKEFSEEGFIFYTNGNSLKAQAIKQNNKVSMLFYWEQLTKQIIIQGTIEPCTKEKSDELFAMRDKNNQLASIASRQGEVLADRQQLVQSFEELQQHYQDGEQAIVRPEYCQCYIIKPTAFEFWLRGLYRLNYRLLYTQANPGWQKDFLYP